jgi:hypothetical protein
MKLYDVPHKGLRNALSQLSLLAGKTDYNSGQEVGTLYELGRAVFQILTIHAEDENAVTLAELEMRCPGCSQHDMDDHERIHVLQYRLEALLETISRQGLSGTDATENGAEFYLALSEFQGMYLEHTAEEERVTQLLLWQHFTDVELADHRARIMGNNPPETLLTWFRFVVPALQYNERIDLLGGFKQRAPGAFFLQGMEVIRKVLTPDEFTALASALNASR